MITIDQILASLHSIRIADAGGDELAIDANGKIGAIVEATDLDIRNLTFSSDKVDASGSVVALDATTLSALENITVTATDLDIRNLTFSQDKVDVSGSVIETVEGGYDTWSVTAATVTTTESTITALANRLRVEIQNLGAQDIYIRESTGVSASNGLKIPKGSSYEQALDAGASIYMVTASGTSDVRIAQYAA